MFLKTKFGCFNKENLACEQQKFVQEANCFMFKSINVKWFFKGCVFMFKYKVQSFNKELTFEQKNYLEQIKIKQQRFVQKQSSLCSIALLKKKSFTFDQIIIQKQSFFVQ